MNPLKAAVGVVNIARGTVRAAAGAALLAGAAATVPVGPVSVPASALGTVYVSTGIATVNRGSQQLSESLSDRGGMSARNILGLLPFGQRFDDPVEPTMFAYFQDGFRQLAREPYESVKQAVSDFFAIGGK